MIENDDPRQDPESDPEDITDFIQRETDFGTTMELKREYIDRIIQEIEKRIASNRDDIESVEYLKICLRNLKLEEDWDYYLREVSLNIEALRQEPSDDPSGDQKHITELSLKQGQLFWVSQIMNEMETLPELSEPGKFGVYGNYDSKASMQAHVKEDETLNVEWKKVFVDVIDGIFEGQSLQDLSDKEEALLMAQAFLKPESRGITREALGRARKAIEGVLSEYEDASDFRYVVVFLSNIAVARYLGWETSDEMINITEETLDSIWLQLESSIVQEALEAADAALRDA